MADPEEIARRALAFVEGLRSTYDQLDSQEPHMVVIRDPETNRLSTHGPYENQQVAEEAALRLRDDFVRSDPEMDNLEFRLALHYEVDS
jgi:hypothetical protein